MTRDSARRVSKTGSFKLPDKLRKRDCSRRKWTETTMTTRSRFMFVPVFLIAGALFAQDAEVTPLMSKDLPEYPGKEGVMITVVYPPGASDPIHRHNAHTFVYVLEGAIVMQVKGGKEVT